MAQYVADIVSHPWENNMHPRFAIAPINWTNDDDPSLGGDIPLLQCLTEMKEAGYTGCELGNKFPKQPAELADLLHRFDLTLTTDWIGTTFTVQNSFRDSLNHFKERVQFLQPFGVTALKVCEVGHAVMQTDGPIFATNVSFTADQWSLLLTGLNEASKIASDHGMYIAYHHHLGTGVQNNEQIERLMHECASITLLPDTGHLFAAGIDPLAIFKKYASRIKYVHLKDVRKNIMQQAQIARFTFMDSVRAGLFTVPSDGCLDFVALFEELKEMDFSGWLVVEAEQDPQLAPPLLYAKKARAFLRQHFEC